MALTFEWDAEKAITNQRRHGLSFEEAATAFADPLSRSGIPTTLEGEDRFVLVGETVRGRLVVVIHTVRGDNLRLISARRATRREQLTYEFPTVATRRPTADESPVLPLPRAS